MVFKLVAAVALLAVAKAGVIPTAPLSYGAPAITHASYAAPTAYSTHGAYAAPATYSTHGAYAAPSTYATHGAYAAPATYATHGAYAAPATYATHGAYAAPAAYATHGAYAAPTVAHAAPLAYAAPVAKAIVTKTVDPDYDPNPQYSYSYDVHDTLTGDVKSQQETRNGDVVEGSYSLVESDGTRRIVHYTADPHNGFNAVVEKEPATVKAYAAPVAHAPVAYHAAPAVKVAAPLGHGYAAPLGHGYSAPLYH